MTWRKFATLVKGLSTQSATITHIQSSHYMGSKGEKVNVVTSRAAAQRQFEALFAPVKKRKPKPNK